MFRSTGTIKPFGSATAIPRFTSAKLRHLRAVEMGVDDAMLHQRRRDRFGDKIAHADPHAGLSSRLVHPLAELGTSSSTSISIVS